MSDLVLPGKATSKQYVHGPATFAESVAAVFEKHAMAVSAFKRVAVDKLAACFSSSLKQRSNGDLKVKNVNWGRLSFPQLGDRSAAYRIDIEIVTKDLSPTAYFDLVFIERKRVLGLLLFVDVFMSFHEALEVRLSRAVAQRMKE